MIWSNRDNYVGHWFDSKMHGSGTMQYADRRIYTGGWLNGRKSGPGSMSWPKGEKCDAVWIDDKAVCDAICFPQCSNGGKCTGPNSCTCTSSWTGPRCETQSKFEKWKQNAIIVAGRNGGGQELNQLKYPIGIFIDEKKNIFIADRDNHRIVEWKYNATEGQIIAGGNKEGDRMDQLNEPTDVIVNQQNHSIIIADRGNGRVIQWMDQNQQILIENIYCMGLAMDKHGFLYVSDFMKNEVRRWTMGEYNNEGIVVAGGNGKGDQLNQLNLPTFIFVDKDQSVYVSDLFNHRVMKWRKDAKEGIIVAGGNGRGGNLNQLSYPEGVVVDDFGQIYVADGENHRVMRWYEGKDDGEIVVGGNGQGNQSDQLNNPSGLSFDNKGNLYVVDRLNHRVGKFEIILCMKS
ncbi:unnamed protein product [Adineta steineri]|uniref:EGF-like domain-containing protein n=2 Tax=Adineta steineri TaxID=433720 RepID=A0A816CBY3_9BILA|nr:unnamed protein product [Adineta steineri]CAF1621196.1 unnamed protein product [Adineta steineri]